MNNGAFGENFPYSNFHDLNMDWIIKIAKDFLDQYTHIQEIIENGEASLQELTESGLEQLQTKATELETLLQEWYNTHSEDIANQLTDALTDLNNWYTVHQNYLDQTLADNLATFTTMANQRANEAIQSIPSDYTKFYTEFQAVQKDLRAHNIIMPKSAWGYFYDYGYWGNNLEFVENSGLALLKIPLPNPSFVILKCPTNFQPSSISGSLTFTWELDDGSLSRSYISGQTRIIASMTDRLYEAGARSWGNVKYVYILVLASMLDNIEVVTYSPLTANVNANKIPQGIMTLTPQNTAYGQIFLSEANYSQLSGDAIAYWITVNSGDRFTNLSRIPGVSYMGSFRSADGNTNNRIYSATFTAPSDGIVCLFDLYSASLGFTYIPSNRIKLNASDIIDYNSSGEYEGLLGVAFGTSLTQRAITGDGYMDYLPSLSGIEFDNQGLGGGTIHQHGDQGYILGAIQNYTGYANKRVCILEGFTNDWGYNYDQLGHYTDQSDATVCGAVRVGLTHILAQNPNITIFLVLDHYGKTYNGVSNSSTAVNRNNQTQYVWYEEISKVAESLGIPVIKLYAISGISENTPQYLMDNIHPTALGARQTAKVIWEQMKLYYPNLVS